LTAALIPAGTSAAPNAEIAKRCMHYSYLVYSYLIYPCKRPGSVRGSGDRQSYSGTAWRKTATYLRRIRRNPDSPLLRMALIEQLAKREDPTHNRNQINSLGLLGSQVVHLAAVRHALVEIVLRYSPTSL
jgi:hypothetical protein